MALHLHELQESAHERLQGRLSVGLQGHARVAEPRDVLDQDVRHEVVLAGALVGDDVCEDGLGQEAAHQDALDQLALLSQLVDLCLALGGHRLFQLLALLQARGRYEEVIEADNCYPRAVRAAMLYAAAPPEDAPFAP